jgi:hypothetical protein
VRVSWVCDTMTQQTPKTPRSERIKAQAKRFSGKRNRRLLNIGCLPVVAIATLALLLIMNAAWFWQAPSWATDPRAYLASGRLILSIGSVSGLQMVVTWGIGLMASLVGIQAATGQGGLLVCRLEVIRRRVGFTAWAVVGFRLILIGLAIIAGLLWYTNIFGFRLSFGPADDAWSILNHYPAYSVIVLIVVVTQLLVGPLLRLRYSLALGALAGTWTRDRDQRPWLALSIRLGLGLAGLVGLLWGAAAVRLLAAIAFDPAGYPSIAQYPDVFSRLPPSATTIAVLASLATGVLVFHTALQLILTAVVLAMARARMARPTIPGYYAVTASAFRDLARSNALDGGSGD